MTTLTDTVADVLRGMPAPACLTYSGASITPRWSPDCRSP